MLQRIDLADRIALEPSAALRVSGFADDTLVREALERLAARAEIAPRWSARITKRIPVAAGLGGGSSDAATALRLANETLEEPLPADALRELGAGLGADVPFFLASGPQVGEDDGTRLTPTDLPQDYWVVLVLPTGAGKTSTGAVYAEFDHRRGDIGFAERRAELIAALERVRRPSDLGALPPNDLASSPLAAALEDLGAFRADVTGAGPVVYGLFARRRQALEASQAMRSSGRVWLTVPAWYG